MKHIKLLLTAVLGAKNHFRTIFLAAAITAAVPFSWIVPSASAQDCSAQVQLPGRMIPQFVDPLPLLSVAGGTIETITATDITLNMLEFKANVMPSTFVPATGTYTGTWVFGYRNGPTTAPTSAVDTYTGPVIVATRHAPTQVTYVNNLTAKAFGDTGPGICWRAWTDQSLHSAFHQIYGMPMPILGNTAHYPGPVPAVPHLHGGEDPAVIDGGPEAFFLSDQGNFTSPAVVNVHGAAYYTKDTPPANEAIYRYPNSQEAAPLWFHDHLLGGTRLNATFAGLAGAYPIIDPALVLPAGLGQVGLENTDGSNPRFTVPLVLQDRMFDTNGQLFFPNVGVNPTEHPFWVPEFVGDTIVVNGKVWPFLNVDRQRYRFYLIEGSNSRPYEMFLQDPKTKVNGPRMWVIATDGGYLDSPVVIDPNATKTSGISPTLVMMPGERYEIIVDFNDQTWLAAETAAYSAMGMTVPNPVNLILRNTAPTVNGPVSGSTDGRIMQFRVSAATPLDTSYNPASGTPIRSGDQTIKRLVNIATGTIGAGVTVDKTRELVLVEIEGSTGEPLEVLVNNSKWNGLRPDGTAVSGGVKVNGNYNTELPMEGQTEVWEVVNTTADAHPIHLHGVQFQILNRQRFKTSAFFAAYAALFPGGVFTREYGPPLDYNVPQNCSPTYPSVIGGNPCVDPYLQDKAKPQLPFEVGWKDTAIMPSGFVTRIAVRFAPQGIAIGTPASSIFFSFDPSSVSTNGQPGYYVWHCHITDHEDNEMMRPYQFQSNPNAIRTYIQYTDY